MAAGTSEANARSLAVATAATEAAGVASHGQATLIVNQTRPSVVTVDAATGFAHSAIELGFEQLTPLTRIQGIAALAVKNSYNCGILGYHTHRLAQAGLLGIRFTNAPASIAPVNGNEPVVGANPFSIAAPDGNGDKGVGIALMVELMAAAMYRRNIGYQRQPVFWHQWRPTQDRSILHRD